MSATACRQRRNLHHKTPWVQIERHKPVATQFDTTAKHGAGWIDDPFDVMAAAASRQNLERLNAAGTRELQTSL